MKNSETHLGLAWALAMIVLFTSSTIQNIFAEEVTDAVRDDEKERLNHSVFFGKGRNRSIESVETVSIHLNEVLKQRIEAVDRICELTETQKQKLDLAGRGAIRRLFENIEEQKRTLTWMEAKKNDKIVFKILDAGPEVCTLRSNLRSGPFSEDSLFAKTLRNVLTREQQSKYSQNSSLAAVSNKKIDAANVTELTRAARLQKGVRRIVWSRDGKFRAFLGFDHRVEVYSQHEDQVVRVFGEERHVCGFDFGPDEYIVAITDDTQNATMINLTNDIEIPIETGRPQASVKISPDGKMLATGGNGTTAMLWSTVTGELVREFDVGPEKGDLTPVFSPDGTVLAVGHSSSKTRLFDVGTGQLLQTLQMSISHELKFDPTGKTLAVVYAYGLVALWDVQTGQLKKSVQAWANDLYSVDWTPDGRILVTAGANSQVTLWNPSDLSILREVESPEWITSVRFSPDGTKLIFAGGGGDPKSERWVETWAVP